MSDRVFRPHIDPPSRIDRILTRPGSTAAALWWIIVGMASLLEATCTDFWPMLLILASLNLVA